MIGTKVITVFLLILLVFIGACYCTKGCCPPINPPGTVKWDVEWIAAEKCSLTVHLEKSTGEGVGKPCLPPGSCGVTIEQQGAGYYYAWVECQGTRYYYDPCLDTIRLANVRPRAPNVTVIPTETLRIHMIIKPVQ